MICITVYDRQNPSLEDRVLTATRKNAIKALGHPGAFFASKNARAGVFLIYVYIV